MATQENLTYITVFGKVVCSYCRITRDILEKLNDVEVTFVYLDDQEDKELEDAARSYMMQCMQLDPMKDARPTVPQIFFGHDLQKGGATNLQKLEQDGTLRSIIKSYASKQPDGLFANLPKKYVQEVYSPNDI
jgi:glutaredoxin